MFTVFISATSDIKELRDTIDLALQNAGVNVLTQERSLGQAPKNVRELLAKNIENSDVVIHIAGVHYGADSGDTQFPSFPGTPDFLCSWTQFEYYYAHALDKDVYAFVMAADGVPEQLRESWTEDDLRLRQVLQQTHRERVFSGKFEGTPVSLKQRTLNDRHEVKGDLDMMSRLAGVVRRGQQDWGGAKDKITIELIGLTRGIAKLRQLSQLQSAQLARVLSVIENEQQQLEQIAGETTTTKRRSGWLLAAVPLLVALLLAVGLVAAPQRWCQLGGLRAACEALGLSTTSRQLAEIIDMLMEKRRSQTTSSDSNDPRSLEALGSALKDITQTPDGQDALLLFKPGKEEMALRALDRVLAIQPRSVAIMSLDASERGNISLDKVIARYEKLVRLNPNAFWDHIELAHLYEKAGNPERALEFAEKGLALAQQQAAADSSSTQAKRYVSISVDYVARIKPTRADNAGGLGHQTRIYGEESFVLPLLIERLLIAGVPQWDFPLLDRTPPDRSFAISLMNQGNNIGSHRDALDRYLESWAIFDELRLLNNTSEQAKRDLSVILEKIGELLATLRTTDDYDKTLDIRQTLYLYSLSREMEGNSKAKQGDFAGALLAYQRSLEIRKALALADPSNTESQRDVSVTLDKIRRINAAQ
jgi:tetratricopeptide (TPR) repeat protein